MGISIKIVAGPDQQSSNVQASGSIQHIITDQERNTFSVNDGDLKNAIGKYFGKKPNDAYVHSPTPWDDLYKKYNWEQVSTVLVVQRAEIMSITSEPTIVATKKFTNDTNRTATINCSIEQEVTNSAESNWNTGGTLTIGQEFEYKAEFLGTGGGGKTSISYSQSWGVGGSHSQQIKVGTSAGMGQSLDPHEYVNAQLVASRGTMKVRITYQAYLRGIVAVNYNPKYKDHHFWGLPIGKIMEAAGISNSRVSTEDINIGFYSDSEIKLKDPQGKTKDSRSTLNLPGIDIPVKVPPILDSIPH